ncbi:LysR family transcriptional regulator [Salinivibrio sp. ML290]|uniref:LysR family transcriptional regulator n=1 Tax=Salinivibrio sp. ML290 TaxID=1909468 RepID=UPI0009884B6D|nr:LysR family transcriptional regulator [Salinivibrio sp. ML290]OOE76896.1 LysR family transcriptional regulator [Salinivibrio sp. ML290]
MINWDDLKYFLALYESGKVSDAAARLNVNHATISRRINRLEDALRINLFDRTGDGFTPSIEGELLYERSVIVRDEVDGLSESISPDARFNQSVKISMVPFLAESMLVEQLKSLQDRFPELRIEVDTSTRNLNVSKQEVDIALRMGLPKQGESICKKVGECSFLIAGNAFWIERLKNGESVNIVTYTSELSHLRECQFLIERHSLKSIRFQADTVSLQKKAAELGYGIALLPEITLRSSPLVTLEPDQPIKRDIWILSSKRTHASTSKKIVMDEVAKICQTII